MIGWFFLALGLIGGLLPVIQGWPFGVLGAAILYLESRAVQRRVYRWRQRHAGFEKLFKRARAYLKERKRQRAAKRARKEQSPR